MIATRGLQIGVAVDQFHVRPSSPHLTAEASGLRLRPDQRASSIAVRNYPRVDQTTVLTYRNEERVGDEVAGWNYSSPCDRYDALIIND